MAFCDNPSWSEYCCSHFYYLDGYELDSITGIETQASSVGRMNRDQDNGFIAYIVGKPVGWVVSFVVDHHHRGKGSVRALLV